MRPPTIDERGVEFYVDGPNGPDHGYVNVELTEKGVEFALDEGRTTYERPYAGCATVKLDPEATDALFTALEPLVAAWRANRSK